MREQKEERFTAWVTKYALTVGIQKVQATRRADVAPEMISYNSGGAYRSTAHGKDWHRSEEAAVAHAEEMRRRKIASLRKSIEKIKALEFKRITP